MGFVYILECRVEKGDAESIFYIGSTLRDFRQRFFEHQSGKAKFTSRFAWKQPRLVAQVEDWAARGVESKLKRNRRVAYDLLASIAGKPASQRVQNFLDWCSTQGVGWEVVEEW